MVTQKQGTEGAVEDMQNRIGGKFNHVFASVGAGKLIPSAYHIKVASRDGEEFWLSSGNWKDSNQADIDPAGEHSTRITPLRQHNREWHAIIANAKLAKLFQSYIEFDFEEANRVPLEEGVEIALPELFVPEEAFMEGLEGAVTAQFFPPLVLDRELEIQPLLTPDRDSRNNRLFMEHATRMIKKGTRKIYVENQSFNLLDDNNDEFEGFFGVLKDKQQAGLDVRIIFRDGREFGASNGPKQQKLLERIKDFGLDTDLIRVQRKCHTKGIIVDSNEVMLGSHNLTNEGSLFNRDASLLMRDPEVAAYFEKIFLFDWETLATQEADELVGGVRIARPGEETPVGFRRVSVAELLGDS
jgi:phosphatidylserine/phosphatidylglycerophosphate/cardiolipin synthase-like enzyme